MTLTLSILFPTVASMSKTAWKQLDLSFFRQSPQMSPPPVAPAPPAVSSVPHDPTSSGDGDGDVDMHRRRIAGYLTVMMPEPIDVIFTNNRSTMVSFRRRMGRVEVRLHRLFRHADSNILDSLALFLGKRDKNASKRLDAFIVEHQAEVCAPAKPRMAVVRTQGKHLDLLSVFDTVNQTYFGGKVDARIAWGRAPRKRKKRRVSTLSRALATYSFDEKMIRLSPILDAPDIPRYVIEWIVYHEMLHHVLPVEKSGGRRQYHTSRFKSLERAFVRYEEAIQWEMENRERLLS